jgi:cold shock CspA family protein
MTGTIRKILREKGFGFSRGSMNQGTDFDQLREGDQVQFQSRPGDKGPRASGVKLR